MDGLTAYAKATWSAPGAKTFWNHISGNAGPQYEPIGQRRWRWEQPQPSNSGAVFRALVPAGGEHHQRAWRPPSSAWPELPGRAARGDHAAVAADVEWRLAELQPGGPGYRGPATAESTTARRAWRTARVRAVRLGGRHAFFAPRPAFPRASPSWEEATRLVVPAQGVPGASGLTTGNTSLRPRAPHRFRELGWRGEFAEVGMGSGCVPYQNRVKDSSPCPTFERLPPGESYDPPPATTSSAARAVNEDSIYTARGAEGSGFIYRRGMINPVIRN